MPRPLWKGAIKFSMVSIPVKLYTATEEKDVRFNMLHKEDLSRVKQKVFCAMEDIELDRSSDIVKGYEVSPDRYVILEEEDFENVPLGTKHEIEITDFVKLEDIDPILYQKTYYLEPEDLGMKPFALLMEALRKTGQIAVGKVTLRQKEQLCTLRLYEGTIVLETMYYPDEVRRTSDLDRPPEDVEISDRDLKIALSIVEMLSGEFDHSQYRDRYREALLEVINKKAEGLSIEEFTPQVGQITDLTEALRASVEAVRKQKKAESEEEGEAPTRSHRAKSA